MINIHKDFAREYFEIQLAALERDSAYKVTRKSDFLALVRVQAGNYLPVFRIQADNFDLEPPLIEFADPVTGERLNDNLWPTGSPIASGNSLFPGPMICVSGNRAYHTHPSHLQDPFHLYRNTFSIKRFLERIVEKIVSGQMNMSGTGGVYNVP